MKLKTLQILLIPLVFAACSTAPERTPTENLKTIKKVSVVSIVGQEFVRSYVGITVFGNEFHVHNITDWELDKSYEAQAIDVLKRLPGITSVNSEVERRSFPKLKEVSDSIDWNLYKSALTQHCARSQADAVLLVVKRGSNGLGVWVSRQQSWRDLVMSAKLALFDCSAARVVAAHDLVNGPSSIFGKLQVPSVPIPNNWPVDGEWQPETFADAHQKMLELPGKSWSYTLTAIFSPK